jgi:DNA mismatch repair protein MutS
MSALMREYNSLKEKYPDALLWYELDNFVQVFGDDAVKTSEILGTALTKNKEGIPLTGFTSFQFDIHMRKVVKAGMNVAFVQKLESPNENKTSVKRRNP